MLTVQDILKTKGNQVWTVEPDASVLAALKEMERRDIGALVVVDVDRPIGIFSERQYARNVFLRGRGSPTTPVKDVMRSDFVYVMPTHTIEECMAIVTEHRVRHLPVIENEKLVGLVSIGDLVKSIIADHQFTIGQLTEYISGQK
jgi:CBS domain-containing protein